MDTQTSLNGVAEVLYEQANFLGLSMIDEGTFQTKNELKSVLDSFTEFELDNDDIQKLLSQGYIMLDGEDINEIDIQTINHEKHVVACLNGLSVIDDFTPIYDPVHETWLLGFSNAGWLDIDGAIDIYTGTIGSFNSETLTYYPLAYLPSDTVELLEQLTYDYCFDMEKSNGKITRASETIL